MFTVGSKCKTGQIVSEILGQSTIACCFFTEDNHIRWEYFENSGQPPANMMPAVNTFDAILKSIKSSVPKDLQKNYYEHAAKSLYSAFQVNDPKKISGAFKELLKSLSEIRNAPIYYAISGLVASIIFIIVNLVLLSNCGTESNSVFFWSVNCGIAGSALSVLQRSGKLWSDPSSSRSIVIAQGAIRPITGALLAFSAVLLIKGNLILGSTPNTFELIVAISFFFGLSERIVPELSKNMERMTVNSNGG
jgi:hypothetical protein